jgi:hypothetical protein
MSKLTNDDKAPAAPCYCYNAWSPKRKAKRNKKKEERIEARKKIEACASSYGFYITKWTGMAANTLFFITECIVTWTLAGWK